MGDAKHTARSPLGDPRTELSGRQTSWADLLQNAQHQSLSKGSRSTLPDFSLDQFAWCVLGYLVQRHPLVASARRESAIHCACICTRSPARHVQELYLAREDQMTRIGPRAWPIQITPTRLRAHLSQWLPDRQRYA